MTTRRSAKPLVLTLGEPAGIGPDITIQAWLRRHERPVPPFLFAGPASLLRRRAAALGQRISVAEVSVEEAHAAFAGAIPCHADCPPVAGDPGALKPDDALAAIASIRFAVEMLRVGKAAAMVTNPVQKKALEDVGFEHPGHTEFLGALSRELFGQAATPVMMLAGPDLRVVPVTIHVPLRAVPELLSTDLIVTTARIVSADMKSRFGIAAPRLALSGLNPHAGENSMLGAEDAAIIRPAVFALRAAGIDAVGPLPADTMFHPAARALYDVAICMYHDQALIPIKTLAFDDGVNVTLGLPFIRTSPDHGTALSIAGSGDARPTSLIAALRMAGELATAEPAE